MDYNAGSELTTSHITWVVLLFSKSNFVIYHQKELMCKPKYNLERDFTDEMNITEEVMW